MKFSNIFLTLVVAILFSGCASMYVPDSDLINKLQIVKMGSKKPTGDQYILHIPAGANIPVQFSLKGDLISTPIDNNAITQLKHELYVYQYWASLDGKNWQPTGEIIKMPITIDVGPEGGKVLVKVDVIK